MRLTTLSALLLFMTLPTSSRGADVERGKAHFATCAACHGADARGLPALNTPQLAGLGAWYIKRQLANFRAGIRGTHADDSAGMQMRPMAMTLPDDQAVADVAAYISSLPSAKTPATVKGDVARGKTLYAPCYACHGDKGQGVRALNGPRLVHQHDGYLLRQMKNFKSGVRGKHPKDTFGAQMAPMVASLADEQAIKDVISYLASLR